MENRFYTHDLTSKKALIFILITMGILYIVQSCNYETTKDDKKVVSQKVSYNFDIRPILSDKCFSCHGPDPNKREAGLRLDIAESAYKALQDNPSAHALVPGKPQSSELFLRITSKDTTLIMPPLSSNLKLTTEEIELIEKWIKQGARYEKHWAFVAPRKPAIPQVENTTWPKNEIDYFVLRKQEINGFLPNSESDKERLLKRVSFDLTGLPPTLEMMTAFLADKSSDAYEKIVDQLLNQPSYGEKMALHWLDVARYADSHGYQDDNYRSQWPWRDWVIHAFNKNMPYDQFITWQLAGDLMPAATKEQILATGFNRNHKITEEGGSIDEEFRVEYVTDRTNTFSKAMLGVTMECAKCHDHKYDPFSQKEYFQLFSFFNNVKEFGMEPYPGGGGFALVGPAKKPLLEITDDDVKKILNFVNKQDTGKLMVSVMGDRDTLRKSYILNRGVYDSHGEEVNPGTPEAILKFNGKNPNNRLGLSKWLFDKRNPLTSRVFVNRVWQEIFGRGIVKTSGDFGMQGELPTHPELLDWLAVDFMTHGWNIKRLMKQLVTSATYRQSAVISPEKLKSDPDNIFLTRAPRYRLPAEFIRDLVLSSSGLLVKEIGGPSVKPYQPAGIWESATSGRGDLVVYKQDKGKNLYRRGIYTFVKRTVVPPALSIFDASNRDQCEIGRIRTNTPLQALVMMNDPTVLEASRVLAAKLLKENSHEDDKIAKAFRLILCRKPRDKELLLLKNYYKKVQGKLKYQNAEKLLNIGDYPQPENSNKIQLAAMMQVIVNIYNLEETIAKS